MKNRLLWKLLLTNVVPVITVIILVIWLAIDQLAADYFMHLMKEYEISPTAIHQMFLTSIHHYLLWASLIALALAFLLSFILIRRVLKPLLQMASITTQLAKGDFSARVEVTTRDEVADLGHAFNKMADSLAKIEQLRKNMVSDLAHELRTPLTNLNGYLEAINDQVLPASGKNMKMLQSETNHLVKLVENLQQLAKADAADIFLRRVPVNLTSEIRHMLDLYTYRFSQKNITVATELSLSGTLSADRDKLLQALRNLFENCLKYTPTGGRVAITSMIEEKKVKVSFINSGPGIVEEDLPYIFERFFRGDRARTRQEGGAGIGLSITKQLIEAHEGQIGATSGNSSTTIWFTLPLWS